jgi:hypothetical protein
VADGNKRQRLIQSLLIGISLATEFERAAGRSSAPESR